LQFDIPRPINSSKGDRGLSEATTAGAVSLWRWSVLAFQWPAALASSGRGKPEISSSASAACTSFLACANSTCIAVMPYHIQCVEVPDVNDPICSTSVHCWRNTCNASYTIPNMGHALCSSHADFTCQHVMLIDDWHSGQVSSFSVSHKSSQQGQ